MAWYTSRVGDKESDTELRYSARSLASSINGGNCPLNLSTRSYDTSKSSVRYVNAAAFIENNAPLKDVATGDKISYNAMSETQSDIVPPLDIKSEENYPTTRDYTFSYRKHCEVAKMDLKPDLAYETWLSAKRKLLSDKALKRKEAEELKQKEIEERKRLAQEKYEKWLEKKSQCSLNQQSTTTNTCIKAVSNLECRPRSQVTTDEARARLAEWERAKRLEEERRRMLKRQEEQRRQQLEEQRRQMAAEAWENWMANVDKKPKPVPLNRGIFTLRGTVSDIFVNPNEWKPIIPINNEN